MDRPLEVGITGGIGSGKSLVCRVFQSLGVSVYDADSRAKSLMTTDGILIRQIQKEFGTLSYRPDGSLDRAYLARVAFEDPLRLQQLNALVHPRVASDYAQWADTHRDEAYLIREAALLFEAGVNTTLGKMVVVYAPEDLRVQRIRARDPQRNETDIRHIMKNQWPEEEKMKRADYVIYNDEQKPLIPQVIHLHEIFDPAHKTNRS
ncbi:MAG: dephospho-CoA kinase [Cytophagales bacterium]|nr:dephospho-CoA kinase [Cytophagales bacterium]